MTAPGSIRLQNFGAGKGAGVPDFSTHRLSDPPPLYLTTGPSGRPYTGFCSSEGYSWVFDPEAHGITSARIGSIRPDERIGNSKGPFFPGRDMMSSRGERDRIGVRKALAVSAEATDGLDGELTPPSRREGCGGLRDNGRNPPFLLA